MVVQRETDSRSNFSDSSSLKPTRSSSRLCSCPCLRICHCKPGCGCAGPQKPASYVQTVAAPKQRGIASSLSTSYTPFSLSAKGVRGGFLNCLHGLQTPVENEDMMPKLLVVLVLLHIPTFASADKYEPQNGDIIFHTSTSSQSEAVQLVTKSKYSHVGIVYKDGKDAYVLEAVEPVKTTPLKKWIARGVDQRFVVKRLRKAKKLLTAEALKEMKLVAQQFLGKCERKVTHYDLCFEWTDKRMYCSELVWKIYERALGIEIGERKRLKDFNLSHKAVEKIRKQRKECPFLPDEWVISPADMFKSPLLKTVFEN